MVKYNILNTSVIVKISVRQCPSSRFCYCFRTWLLWRRLVWFENWKHLTPQTCDVGGNKYGLTEIYLIDLSLALLSCLTNYCVSYFTPLFNSKQFNSLFDLLAGRERVSFHSSAIALVKFNKMQNTAFPYMQFLIYGQPRASAHIVDCFFFSHRTTLIILVILGSNQSHW